MIGHALGCAAATALVVLIALLPFLPGSYDPLAAPLSLMARAFGLFGLLLVPFGAAWLARPRRGVAIAALIAASLVWALVSLVALMAAGLSLAVATLLAGAAGLLAAGSRLAGAAKAPALYLLLVPPAAFALQLALVGPAVAASRDRAIRNAAPLIAEIERHRAARGAYPPSLFALHPDWSPGVRSVDRYVYEPAGEAYNLLFEQVAHDPATRELVIYNPRDEQAATSHAAHLLWHGPAARGWFAVHATAHAHWKYFWFD